MDFVIFMLCFCLVLLVILIIGVSIASAAEKTEASKKKIAEDAIVKNIKSVYPEMPAYGSAQVCINYVADRVYKHFLNKREEILKKNQISTVYDSKSERNGFATANGYFFYGIPMPSYEGYTLIFTHPTHKFVTVKRPHVQTANRLWNIPEWLKHTRERYNFYNTSAFEKLISKIKIEDIMYYTVQGDSQYVSITRGGGVNMEGAITGGLLFGNAGAIIGGQMGTEIHTDVKKMDDRKILLYYKSGTIIDTLEIKTNINEALSTLRKTIPEKDMLFVYNQK